MKYFWNYIFYFTWMFSGITEKIFVKPVDFILYKIPCMKKRKKIIEFSYGMVVKNPSIGVNILFAYRTMLSTTSVILLNFILFISHTFDISFVDCIEPWFGKQDWSYNVWAAGIVIMLLTNLINEKLLRWHSDGYMQYFEKFSTIENKRKGYYIMSLFHLCPILLLILLSIFIRGKL